MELNGIGLSLIDNSIHTNSRQGHRFALCPCMRHQNIFYVPAPSKREKPMLTYKNIIFLHIWILLGFLVCWDMCIFFPSGKVLFHFWHGPGVSFACLCTHIRGQWTQAYIRVEIFFELLLWIIFFKCFVLGRM